MPGVLQLNVGAADGDGFRGYHGDSTKDELMSGQCTLNSTPQGRGPDIEGHHTYFKSGQGVKHESIHEVEYDQPRAKAFAAYIVTPPPTPPPTPLC